MKKNTTTLPRFSGKVIWFNKEKGYGEIISKKETFFFTYEEIISNNEGFKELIPNTDVEFQVDKTSTSFGQPFAKSIIEVCQ